jgi:glc operon protein GlcG
MRQKPCLTHEDVRILAEACRQKAMTQQLAVTIAIVDDGGHLWHLERLDARPSTIEVAIGKARTAALMRAPSAALEDLIKDMPGILALNAMPLRGALPVMVGEDCVGAIGVSGAQPVDDESIAEAGLTALTAYGPLGAG